MSTFFMTYPVIVGFDCGCLPTQRFHNWFLTWNSHGIATSLLSFLTMQQTELSWFEIDSVGSKIHKFPEFSLTIRTYHSNWLIEACCELCWICCNCWEFGNDFLISNLYQFTPSRYFELIQVGNILNFSNYLTSIINQMTSIDLVNFVDNLVTIYR